MDTIRNGVVPLRLVKPHPDNYNQHPETQIADLQSSLELLSQYRSVVLWAQSDGSYIQLAGHGVVEAMKRKGDREVRADILPVELDPMTAKQIMLADNLHARNSLAEDDILARLLKEQQLAGVSLASLGSDEEELRQLLETAGSFEGEGDGAGIGAGGDDYEVNPDEVEIRCQRGELWQLGKHCLLVDDSTRAENVRRLLQGERAVLMATDPPYGDSWVQKAKDMQAHGYGHSRAGLHGSIDGDELNVADLKAFLLRFLEAAKAAGDAPMPFYVWHRAKRIIFESALLEAGYFVHQPIVWVKAGFVIGRLHYHPRCEWALHGWRTGNGPCPFYGERNQSDVWEIDRENDKIHPTQKPLRLFDIPLLNHTKPNEICYEPFAGSGTQIISAERLSRRCYAMEIDEKYATVCINRWEQETGQTASLIEQAAMLT